MEFIDRVDPEVAAILDFLPGSDLSEDIPAARERTHQFLDLVRATMPDIPGVAVHDETIPGLDGNPDVIVRVYRPESGAHDGSALLNIHGGGMVMMRVVDLDAFCKQIVVDLGIMVVSPEYRLAPEHPYPAAMDDCFATLAWMHDNAADLGIDPDRVAIGGASAGGGLAAGLAIRARDDGRYPVCFQWLQYPMLDDRNTTPSSQEITEPKVWHRRNNLAAWAAYLGEIPSRAVPLSASPARAEVDELVGLPPTYIDVGEVDAFRDEDVAYAVALLQAGVPTELHVTPGAFHASEMYAPAAASSRRIAGYRLDALRRGLADR